MRRSPGLAARIIRWTVRDEAVARSIVGDLHEEYRDFRSRRSAVTATAWYWRQVLGVAVRYRTTGLTGTTFGAGANGLADAVALDIRYAMRGIRRAPASAAVIVITLALAIGANATMFEVIDRLLLSPPPHIDAPQDVVRLHIDTAMFNGERYALATTSFAVFEDLRNASLTEQRWAVVAAQEAVVGTGEAAESAAAAAVSGNYFNLLGTEAALGRVLNPLDDSPPGGRPVVVLSDTFWRRAGADRSVLGSEIIIDGVAFTVVGVAPRGFNGDGVTPVDMWMPINAAFAQQDPSWRHDRRRRFVSIVGRIDADRSDTALEETSRTLAEGAGYAAGAADAPAAVFASLVPGRGPQGASTQARISLWLGGVAAVVLLVAVANVGNLVLLRAQQRKHEFAVRLALGVGWGRLARQMLTETALLALLSGFGALLVSVWAGAAMRAALLPDMATPPGNVSGRVGVATAIATVAVALVAGLLPTLQLRAGSRLADAMAPGSRARHRSRLRAALLFAQTSMSVVLLVGAGLFVVSLHNVQAQDLGMRLDRVLLAEIEFGDNVGALQRDSLYIGALDQVRKIPGVELAVAAHTIPFGPFMTIPIGFPGEDFSALFASRQIPYFHAVEPDFFDLMGVDMVDGRPLNDTDSAAAPPVVVVSESLARYVWPGQSVLGKCMYAGMAAIPTPESFGAGAGPEVPCYEIVGVSRDVQERSLRAEDRLTMQWYTTFAQFPPLPPEMNSGARVQALLVRVSGTPEAMAGSVQRVMQGHSARIPFVKVRPYRDLIDPGARNWQLGATMFSAFGALALAIAAVGMYGVLAFAVAQRTEEIGVRMALGAQGADVARLVVGQSLLAVGWGVAGGLIVSLLLTGYIEDLLYETSGANPLVLAGVAALLAIVAFAASVVPALRATRTDPKTTLAAG